MTNTTELRKRFDTEVNKWLDPMSDYGGKELVDFLTKAINYSSVIRVERPRKNAEHPTMKPVALITRLLSNSAKRGQIVLDSFGGGGSTMIAAETLGMKAYLAELDPKYCDVIINRWENYTGKKAQLVTENE